MSLKNNLKRIMPKGLFYYLLLLNNKKHSKYSKIKMKKYISKEYRNVFKKDINWDNPVTYNEKLNVSKLLNYNAKKTLLTDKYLVRDWVKSTIGEEYLIPLLGVYDKIDDINFEKLPNKFVLKCNHDSGSVTICENKENIKLKDLRRKYKFYMKRNFAYNGFEMHYKYIKPKIIVEKYMGRSIIDYKFLCFDGNPYFCRVDIDRFGNHMRNIYDMNWNLQKFNKGFYKNKTNVEKPKNFDDMVKIAKKLSKGIDQVRVDLYSIDNRIYFGEMTFTNGNGTEKFYPDEYDKIIGELWNLSNNK